MRIIFFINDLSKGGKERQFIEIVKYIYVNYNVKCQVVLFNNTIKYNELDYYDISINVLGETNESSILKIFRFQKIIKDFKPDVVHTFIGICTLITSMVRFFTKSFKIIDNSVRGVQKNRQYGIKKIFIDKINFFFSDKIVGNSYAGLKSYGVPHNKGLVIYNGYDFSRNNNLVNKEIIRKKFNIKTKFIVGMVASFIPVKDYNFFFDIAIKFCSKNKNISFIAVGDGPQLEHFKSKVKKSKTENIFLIGLQDDIESIINTFDVGLLFTDSSITEEGISNTIIEFMALKIPVIATKGRGTSEIIKNDYNGYLVDNQNIDDLIIKIEKLLFDSKVQRRFSNAGIKTIETKFNMVNVGMSFYKLYEQII